MADNNGWTAFHYAAHNNFQMTTELLLSVDKSVACFQDNINKRTALHVAAYYGSLLVIHKLLTAFPDAWDSVDENGQNILHIAVKQDKKSVIDYILSEENFNMRSSLFIQRDRDGNTPLHLIAKFGYYFPRLKDAHRWTLDWEAIDEPNFTTIDVPQEKQTDSTTYEALVGVALNRTRVRSDWKIWIADKALEVENAGLDDENKNYVKEVVNSHMIVAALVATVALTAGFAMPGGFDGNQGPNQGSAILLRKPAFKAFVVADTIALLCSISSLFFYFLTSINHNGVVVVVLVFAAVILNVASITAMMVAFIAGTSAVLSHSSGLTITVCVISSLFLLLVFSLLFVHFRPVFKKKV